MSPAADAKDASDLAALAEAGLARARSRGCDHAEIYLWEARRVAASRSKGGSTLRNTDESGIGVRFAVGQRVAAAHTSGLSVADLEWAVDESARAAKTAPENRSFRSFAAPAGTLGPLTAIDPACADPEEDRLVAAVEEAEEAFRKDGAITYHSASLTVQSGRFLVANTEGVQAWDRNAYETLVIEARAAGAAEKGAIEMRSDRRPIAEGVRIVDLATDAIARAKAATHAKPLPHTVREAILDPSCVMQLLARASAAFSGSAAVAGRNPLRAKRGEIIASPVLTLTDVPRGPRGARNQRVDDEGAPTQRTPIVEKGALSGLLYGNEAAQIAGVPNTGHGLRTIDHRYAATPKVHPANMEIEPGDWTLEEMVQNAPEAILVRDLLMGSFALNVLTGDFSLLAPLAFYVRGGKVEGGLLSTTFAGNLYEILRNVRAVGRDPVPFRNGRAVPLHVGGVTCAT
ncbi:MAG: TldD/PmbA family protein [Thermoplasmatota archaeon]